MPLKNYKKVGNGSTASLPKFEEIFRNNPYTRTTEDMCYQAQVAGTVNTAQEDDAGPQVNNGL